jgi:hypothetical protein
VNSGYFTAGYGYDPILGSSFTQSYLTGGAGTVGSGSSVGNTVGSGGGFSLSGLGNVFAGIGTGLHNLLSASGGVFPNGAFGPQGQFIPQGAVATGGVAAGSQVNIGALLLIVGGAVLFLKRK